MCHTLPVMVSIVARGCGARGSRDPRVKGLLRGEGNRGLCSQGPRPSGDRGHHREQDCLEGSAGLLSARRSFRGARALAWQTNHANDRSAGELSILANGHSGSASFIPSLRWDSAITWKSRSPSSVRSASSPDLESAGPSRLQAGLSIRRSRIAVGDGLGAGRSHH